MRAAVDALKEPFLVVEVPTLYPAGGAKQLIRVLTGKEVPASKRSTDLGVQCFNVATAYTAWRAIARCMSCGRSTCLTSTAETLMPHGSVC